MAIRPGYPWCVSVGSIEHESSLAIDSWYIRPYKNGALCFVEEWPALVLLYENQEARGRSIHAIWNKLDPSLSSVLSEGSLRISVEASRTSLNSPYDTFPFSPFSLRVVKSSNGTPFVVGSSSYRIGDSFDYPNAPGWGIMIKSFHFSEEYGLYEAGRFGGDVFFGGPPISEVAEALGNPPPSSFSIYYSPSSIYPVSQEPGLFLVHFLVHFLDKQSSPFYLLGEDYDTSATVIGLFRIYNDGTIGLIRWFTFPASYVNYQDVGWSFYRGFTRTEHYGPPGSVVRLESRDALLLKLHSEKDLFIEGVDVNEEVVSARVFSLVKNNSSYEIKASEPIVINDPRLAQVFDSYDGYELPRPSRMQVAGMLGNKIIINPIYTQAVLENPIGPYESYGIPIPGYVEQAWFVLDYEELQDGTPKISIDRVYFSSWFDPIEGFLSNNSIPRMGEVVASKIKFSENIFEIISEKTGIDPETIERSLHLNKFGFNGNTDQGSVVFGSTNRSYSQNNAPTIRTEEGCEVIPFKAFLSFLPIDSEGNGITNGPLYLTLLLSITKQGISNQEEMYVGVHLVNVSEGHTSGTGAYLELSQIAPSENGRVWLFGSIDQHDEELAAD